MVAAFGLAYLVIGLAFGALAANAATVETRQLWRIAAWFLSAIAFSFHLRYEFIRRQRAPFGAAPCGIGHHDGDLRRLGIARIQGERDLARLPEDAAIGADRRELDLQ